MFIERWEFKKNWLMDDYFGMLLWYIVIQSDIDGELFIRYYGADLNMIIYLKLS